MRTKCLTLLAVCLVVAFITGSASASIYAVQTGDWSDTSTWDKGFVPDDTEEIKIGSGDGSTVTVSTDVGLYSQKVDVARDCTLEVVAGGSIGAGNELRVGDAGMSGSGTDIGYVSQTGGTVDVTGKLLIGYKATGDGTYTISGGTLSGSTGRTYIGCAGADGAIGKLSIVGDSATISLGNTMYIANDSSSGSGNIGQGTVEFKLSASGTASKLQVLESIIDSQAEVDAVAALVVDATLGAPGGDIVLIENTGGNAVVGAFDTLNGGSGAEGSYVVLGSSTFQLTYLYAAGADMVGNDIALVLVPEPATLAILGLGGLFLRRRLA